MKEISIEQKAKRYDEALKYAMIYYKDGNEDMKMMMKTCFPVLVEESEDERIKRVIRQVLDESTTEKDECYSNNRVTQQEVFAWLEKQCTPAKLSEEEQNRFAKGVLTSCAISFVDYLDAHKYEGKMCVSNGECEDIENAFHNAMWDRLHRYYCKYIEKQGAQKPTDKVEPKFHEGDWIIHQGTENIYQVVAVIDNQYQLKYGDNYTIQKCADVDRCARLWDIAKDAKDGDVLVSESTCGLGTWYCIFKSLDGDESMTVYCYLARDGRFETKKELCFDKDPYNTKPATKEQRDKLEKVMANAGYEWDADKKELKKIEQSPIDVRTTGYWHVEDVEKNPTWSKEDERMFNSALWHVKNSCGNGGKNSGEFEVYNWLKALKDRVQPKPRQEWSEWDRILQDSSISYLCNLRDTFETKGWNKVQIQKCINWLKSLRPQSHWKPSDEQIGLLQAIVNDPNNASSESCQIVLKEVIKQLKKLKG